MDLDRNIGKLSVLVELANISEKKIFLLHIPQALEKKYSWNNLKAIYQKQLWSHCFHADKRAV